MVPDNLIELRGMTPRSTIDVLDAVSIARKVTRIELVNEILGSWATEQMHIAQRICSVVGHNPQHSEEARK